jgi:hypothetical protein
MMSLINESHRSQSAIITYGAQKKTLKHFIFTNYQQLPPPRKMLTPQLFKKIQFNVDHWRY